MKHSNCCAQIGSINHTNSVSKSFLKLSRKAINQWIKDNLIRFAKAVSRTFTLYPEPYISKHLNRQGELYYRVYDPDQKTHHRFISEEAVRIWLEERHHQ